MWHLLDFHMLSEASMSGRSGDGGAPLFVAANLGNAWGLGRYQPSDLLRNLSWARKAYVAHIPETLVLSINRE
jgi:hypothetical protein